LESREILTSKLARPAYRQAGSGGKNYSNKKIDGFNSHELLWPRESKHS